MFGKILYISDNMAYIENKMKDDVSSDLLNLHLIFEKDDHKILSEITEVNLRNDKFFVRNMFLQLKVTIARLRYGICLKNGLLSEDRFFLFFGSNGRRFDFYRWASETYRGY